MCLYGYEFPRFRWDNDSSLNTALDEALDQVCSKIEVYI